jgi:hypothetical protein
VLIPRLLELIPPSKTLSTRVNGDDGPAGVPLFCGAKYVTTSEFAMLGVTALDEF